MSPLTAEAATAQPLPVERVITTKRKYVEVLMKSKSDTVNTNVVERDNEDPRNLIERYTSSKAPFSIIEDRNPRSSEWFQKVMRSA